jgi:DNA gyrase subunit A
MEKFALSMSSQSYLGNAITPSIWLEQNKIHDELTEIKKPFRSTNKLSQIATFKNQILIDEALDIKARFGDSRRTDIDVFGDYDIDDEDLIPVEDVIIAVTTNGYVKRMNIDVYRSQNRGGKGKTGIKMNEDDVVDRLFRRLRTIIVILHFIGPCL